jgi:hypothetical protein
MVLGADYAGVSGADTTFGGRAGQGPHQLRAPTVISGCNRSMIAVDADADLVVVFLSSLPEPTDAEQRMTQRRLVDAIAKALR